MTEDRWTAALLWLGCVPATKEEKTDYKNGLGARATFVKTIGEELASRAADRQISCFDLQAANELFCRYRKYNNLEFLRKVANRKRSAVLNQR